MLLSNWPHQVIDLVVPDNRRAARCGSRRPGSPFRQQVKPSKRPRDRGRHPDLAVRSHPAQGELLACRTWRCRRAASQVRVVPTAGVAAWNERLDSFRRASSVASAIEACFARSATARRTASFIDISLLAPTCNGDARVAAQVPADVDDAVAAVQAQSPWRDGPLDARRPLRPRRCRPRRRARAQHATTSARVVNSTSAAPLLLSS